jgi:transcriptional regulator with XRE-family HTH domain
VLKKHFIMCYRITKQCKEVTLVSRVASERKKLGLTQEQLAKRIGIERASLAHIERGRRPSITTAYRLAKTLGLPVEELFPATFVLQDNNTASG